MMSEDKKGCGRGRGISPTKNEDGPRSRSKKLDELTGIRRPKEVELESMQSPESELNPADFSTVNELNETNTAVACPVENPTNVQDSERLQNPDFELNPTVISENLASSLNQKDTTSSIENAPNLTSLGSEGMPNDEVVTNSTVTSTDNIGNESNQNVLTTPVENSSTQDILSKSNLSPWAEEFVPLKNKAVIPAAQNLPSIQTVPDKMWMVLIPDVDDTLNFCFTKLIESPGMFDDLMSIMKKHLLEYLKYDELCHFMVEEIYSFAMSGVSHAYHSVKLLCYMIQLAPEVYRDFRTIVLSLIQQKVKGTLEQLYVDDDYPILELLLFISELYIQLEVGTGRLIPIGRAVADTIRTMLFFDHLPVQKRFTNALNVLKLTGTYLDKDDKTILDSLLEDLEQKLKLERHNLDENTVAAFEVLISQRSGNWNEAQNSTAETSVGTHFALSITTTHVNKAVLHKTVFYGPDREILTHEELLFLDCQTRQTVQCEISPGSTASTASMDGEMLAAFEEFLLLSPESN